MFTRPRLTRVLTVAAVLATLLVSTIGASAQLTVKGDQAAWAEIAAAYKKLYALSGFRMKLVAPEGQPSMVTEMVPPNSFHTMMEMAAGSASGSGSMEIISVGGQGRYRVNMPGAPAKWMCQGGPPVQAPSDPSAVQGTVEAARGPDTAIDGTPVHAYIYTSTISAQGQSVVVKTTLYVGAQTGLPRRAINSVAGHESMIDYYDYGAKLDIALPPCG